MLVVQTALWACEACENKKGMCACPKQPASKPEKLLVQALAAKINDYNEPHGSSQSKLSTCSKNVLALAPQKHASNEAEANKETCQDGNVHPPI